MLLNFDRGTRIRYSCVVFQDKTVAFKIFELGLKKFGQFPDYVVQYIDYMSHLNGKNYWNMFTKTLVYLTCSQPGIR